MRHTRIIIILAALLLGACGSTEQAIPPLPSSVATSAPAAPPTSVAAAPTAGPVPTRTAARAPTSVPATAAPTTPPTAVPAPSATPQPPSSKPVRLVIDAIELDQPLVSVGLDENRVPIVPNHDAAWYNLSAMPGQGENIVLWGHVLRFKSAPKIPAPFARIKELKPGASVVLYDEDGNAHDYVVTQQVQVKPDEVEYILPRGKEQISLVSCIGDKVVADGTVEMTRRLITIAEPAQ